ncbi:MAG: hypothetical protein AB1696_13995 [Planctomycetota bacterium]
MMGARILKTLLAATLISISASVAIGTYLRSKQSCFLVTLSPDGAPSPDVLRQAVSALSRRTEQIGRNLGIVRATICAEEDGPIKAVIWAESDVDEFLRRLLKRGEMEFRLVRAKGSNQEPDADHDLLPWRQEYYSLREPGRMVTEVTPFLVKKEPEHRVRSFESVSCRTEGLEGATVITLCLHPNDAQILNRIRRANMGKEMAVVVDGEVLVSAVIADSVESDRIEIRGIRGVEEARRVANLLEIGALPVRLEITRIEKVKSAT